MTNDPLGTFRDQLSRSIGGLPARRRRRARTVAAATVVVVLAIVGAWLVVPRADETEVVVADGPSSITVADAPTGPANGSVPTDCPVTQPPEPGLAVPDRWPERPRSGVWYGTVDLWTVLPADGSSPTPRKSVWWSVNFPGGSVEQQPDIAVTWQRLDKPAESLRADSGTNAFTAEEGSFMIAGIDPPSAGCWKVTASYRGASLSYVYWNPPRLFAQPLPSGASSGGGALIEGQVRFDDTSNCFFLEQAGQRLPVVWPAGTSVSNTGSAIVLADGRTVELGDHVAGAGSYRPVEDDLRFASECLIANNAVAVFDLDANLDITK